MVKDKIISKQKNSGLSNKNYNRRGLQLLLEIRRDARNKKRHLKYVPSGKPNKKT